MQEMQKGSASPTVLITIIGIFLVGALIAIFYPSGVSRVKTAVPAIERLGYIQGQNINPSENRETDAYYIKADIDKTVCGIKVFSPLPGQQVSFPLEVSGYVNGCNWTPFEGQVGKLEIRDMNNAISKIILLPVDGPDNYTMPAYFKIKITPEQNPTSTDGVLIFHNNVLEGETKETFQVPISF
jgi:hypothetical protein